MAITATDALARTAVNSIAALKSTNISAYTGGEHKLVTGYYAANDGGGGVFRYNPANTTTQTIEGTIIAPNTGSGRWERIYSGALEAKWFGAKCDGTTNDTSAVQTPIDMATSQGGGEVILPPGTNTRASVILKSGVTLTTVTPGIHGYPDGSIGTATIQALDGSTGYVIDTPSSGSTVGCSVVGLNVIGTGALGTDTGGIRFQNVYEGAIKQVALSVYQEEAIKIASSSIGCVLEDILASNSVNRTRSAYIGVLDIDGSDHFVSRAEVTASTSALISTNQYICAIVVRGANHFFDSCIGEISDRGWVVAGSGSRFSNCRADLNYGDGWYIPGGFNSFSSCHGLSNGRGSTNTHDGFVVDGYGNQFSSCVAYQASGSGSTYRYGFNDNAQGAGIWQRSHYAACLAVGYDTAPFYTDSYVGSAPLWAPHPVRIADATAIPDVGQTSFILFGDYTTPTTVTNFLNGTVGQTIKVLGKSVVTIANNANIQTSTGANKVLVTDAIYEFTYYLGKWYEASNVLDSSGGVSAASLTTSGQLAGSTGVLDYGATLGYGMAVQANANVTPVTVAAAVSTAQNLMSYSVPAGLLNVVGRTLRVKGAGLYSTQATAPNITLTITLGGTTIATFGAATAISSTTSAPWNFEVLIGTVSTGASGTLEVHGDFNPRLSTAAGALSTFADNNTAVSGAIDLTTAKTLQVQWTYSNASTSNSVTQRQMHALLSG